MTPFEIVSDQEGKSFLVICRAEASDGDTLVIIKELSGKERILALTEKEAKERFAGKKEEEKAPADQDGDGGLDPGVEEFLDADSAAKRLEILYGLRDRLTDDMIDTMAVACGVEIGPGTAAERYADLRGCLLTIEKFETERGRLR